MIRAICKLLPNPYSEGHFPEGLLLDEEYGLEVKEAKGNLFIRIFTAQGEEVEVTTPAWIKKCFGVSIRDLRIDELKTAAIEFQELVTSDELDLVERDLYERRKNE